MLVWDRCLHAWQKRDSHLGRVLTLSMLLFLPAFTALAQPNLNLKRVVNNWPMIEVYYSVACGGSPVWNLSPGDIRLYDNGREITQFTMSCPDPTVPCAMSTALVFDASGSMAGPGNAGAIQAGKAFVGTMDGTFDEAAVFWYNSNVTLQQGMTSDTALLSAAIGALPAGGATAIWDGIYAGLLEVQANGQNNCRAVIAMTDGMDNNSTVFPATLVSFANTHHIRIYTVGLGTAINSTELEQVALLTGGKYFETSNAAALEQIYLEISQYIHEQFQECRIDYTATCPDGAIRLVDLHVQNICGGSDVKSKTYRAPLDTAALTPLPLDLADVVTDGGEEFAVPLMLASPLNGEILTPLSFSLCFNTHLFEYLGAEIQPGTLLEGLTVTSVSIACGIRVQTTGSKAVFGAGELLRLKFRAIQSPLDTVVGDLAVMTASFESGCLKPWMDGAEVTVLPGHPMLNCDMDAPRQLTWDNAVDAYTPGPFLVTFPVFNTGTIPSTGGSCTIDLDTTVFRLVSPTVPTVALEDIPPGEFRAVTWQLVALPQIHADSSMLTVSASFGNHTPIDCSIRVHFTQSEPILVCSLELPVLTADTAAKRYVPNPFIARVTVLNIGVVPADSVFAALDLPVEMSLAGPDLNGPWVKSVLPFQLQPGQAGTTQWQVYHPLIQSSHVDTIRAHTWANRGGNKTCEDLLTVPPVSGPILSVRCAVPDSLHFDTAAHAYAPNPFTVELSCVNTGTESAYDVEGTLQLPAGVELDPPGQPLTQSIQSGPVAPWHVGDPVPTIFWTVRWTQRDAFDIHLPFHFTAAGRTHDGTPLMDVPSNCSVRVPGLRKDLTCGIDLVDSLQLDQTGHNVEPNPVTVRYWARNTGEQDIRLKNVMLNISADGLSLNQSSPLPSSSMIDVLLKSGDSTEFLWLVDVRNRSYARSVVIVATLIDTDGDPSVCDAHLFIPGINGTLECSVAADSITADVGGQQYLPMPFSVTLTASSSKASMTDSIRARILLPPGGLALAAADAGQETKPLSPVWLFPQQQGQAQWMLEHPLTTVDLRYTVTILVWEKGGDTSSCETEVHIPAMPAPFWFTLGESGPTSFCEGGQVTLSAGSGYATYLWSTGDTTQSITVNLSGTFSCGVTAADGTPGLSNAVTVTVYPLPAKPVISRSGDVLTTDPAAAWQWYRDGSVVPGANTQTFSADVVGNYQVQITDTNGCEALSDMYVVSVLNVDEGQAAGQRFTLYPNPSDGILNINVTLERPALVRFILRDILGRRIRQTERAADARSFIEHLDLRDLLPGVYFIQLEAGSMRETKMVTIR